MACEIVLTARQIDFAASVSDALHDRLRSRGISNAHGAGDELTREIERMSAAAELAVSLYLGVKWTSSQTDDAFSSDVGERTQVRSSGASRKKHNLIVRQRDIEKYGDVPFVLVTWSDRIFTIRGWTMSCKTSLLGRFWDGGDSSRPKAWFVPENALCPIGMLTLP